MVNGPGVRPYIAGKTKDHWMWQRWDIQPGEIYLTPEEKAFATPWAGMVMVEPHTKVRNGNKAWPWTRWQSFVSATPDVCFVQAGPDGTRWLEGVTRVRTNDFRLACSVLAASKAFVGCEGALHHAAAALDVPAIVLWSEFIAPEFTGYMTQRNVRHSDGWCGSRAFCGGCLMSMKRITVDEVVANLREMI